MLHIQSPLLQQNPSTNKRKQAAEADDFQFEVGSPAKHSKPPAYSQVESATTTCEPPREDSEPSTSITKHSQPSTSIQSTGNHLAKLHVHYKAQGTIWQKCGIS